MMKKNQKKTPVPLSEQVKNSIRSIPDWPKKGVIFRDLTTLWKDARMLRATTDAFYLKYRGKRIHKVLGIEARGFIVGAPLAERLGVGFVPARKVGKLPFEKVAMTYDLEYSHAGIELHSDAISHGERVLIVDDLMATGGTAVAAANLVERLGGKVAGIAFVVELAFLNGREKLKKFDVFSLASYRSETER
jgi:adenine phosphoribosyltransferase